MINLDLNLCLVFLATAGFILLDYGQELKQLSRSREMLTIFWQKHAGFSFSNVKFSCFVLS